MMLLQPKFNQMAQNGIVPLTCSKTEVNLSSAWVTRLECPKGVKDDVKQARRAKRGAEGHQLQIGAQRAPRFLVCNNNSRKSMTENAGQGVGRGGEET